MIGWILFIGVLHTRNFAILLNTSRSYTNLRHSVDIQIFNNLLNACGYGSDQIKVSFSEDQIQNKRSPFAGSIYLDDHTKTKYTQIKPVRMDLNYVISLLELNCKELKHLNENDNLFIYLCGHGRETFLKICNRYFFFQGDLMKIIKTVSRRINKVLLIVDTCEAESLINRNEIPSNVFVVTTSLESESAYSSAFNIKLGVSPVNLFPYLFNKKNLVGETRLVDLFKEFKAVDLHSTLTFCKKEDFVVKDFFSAGEDLDEPEIKPFVIS